MLTCLNYECDCEMYSIFTAVERPCTLDWEQEFLRTGGKSSVSPQWSHSSAPPPHTHQQQPLCCSCRFKASLWFHSQTLHHGTIMGLLYLLSCGCSWERHNVQGGMKNTVNSTEYIISNRISTSNMLQNINFNILQIKCIAILFTMIFKLNDIKKRPGWETFNFY